MIPGLTPLGNPIVTFVLLAIVFHALWWISSNVLLKHHMRLYGGSEQEQQVLSQFRRYNYLLVLHVLSPLIFALVLAGIGSLGEAHGLLIIPGEWLGVGLYVATVSFPNVILYIPYLNKSISQMSKASLKEMGTSEPRRVYVGSALALLLLHYLGFIAVAVMFDAPADKSAKLIFTIFSALVLLGLIVVFQKGSGAKRGKVFDLDESPLRTELEKIASATDVKLKSIKVIPMRQRNTEKPVGLQEQSTQIATWWKYLRLANLTIPSNVLHNAEAAALTAGFASRYVASQTLDNIPLHKVLNPKRLAILGASMYGLALIPLAGIIFWATRQAGLPISTATGELARVGLICLVLVACVVVLAVLLYLMGRQVARFFRIKRTHTAEHIRRCAEVWIAADPGANRTEADYLRQIGCFNLTLNPILTREKMFDLFMGFEGISAYLDELPESERKVLVESIREEMQSYKP